MIINDSRKICVADVATNTFLKCSRVELYIFLGRTERLLLYNEYNLEALTTPPSNPVHLTFAKHWAMDFKSGEAYSGGCSGVM